MSQPSQQNNLTILVGCADFSRLTGMPIYLRTICRQFIAEGHSPIIAAPQIGLKGAEQIRQLTYPQLQDNPQQCQPDILLLNEPSSEILCDLYPNVPAYNIIHSARPDDEPIIRSQVRKYICPKKRDADYCRSRGVPEGKIMLLPIPIDLGRFAPQPSAEIQWDIVAPCTFDFLRQKMLLDLVAQAKLGKRVLLIGEDHGALRGKTLPKSFEIIPKPAEDITPYIARSACVASLYEGTIAIEGWAMGKPCLIYDEKGKSELREPPADIEKHSVKRVARRFIDLFLELWADIIIPHHNRADLLQGCLASLPPLNYNVIVAKYGGSFSFNNNQGARQAKTDTLVFLNDDTILNPRSLWEMIDCPADVVSCPQLAGEAERHNDYDGLKRQISQLKAGEIFCRGIGLRHNPMLGRIEYYMTTNKAEALYPSGAFFKLPRALFKKLGGFDESFKNGGEDQDMFLRAYELGASFGGADTPIIHFISSSAGRFDQVDENELLLRKLWLDNHKRLGKIFNLPKGA